MDRDAKQPAAEDSSVLGRAVTIKGRISGEGDLVVEGAIDGEITIDGQLHVAPGGQVHARVDAGSALIEGAVEGDVVLSGAVRLGAGAVLRGTVTAEGFSMEEGASVSATVVSEFDLPAELTGPER